MNVGLRIQLKKVILYFSMTIIQQPSSKHFTTKHTKFENHWAEKHTNNVHEDDTDLKRTLNLETNNCT